MAVKCKNGLMEHIENLVDQESSASWKPFPEHYVDTRIKKEINIPQISLEKKPVHVLCKMTDDFATMQQYSFDDDSLPPKVLCWNDLSALDIKMATKTVKAGLEHEYKYFIDDLSISFQSVSQGNRDPLPIPVERQNNQIIYHVLDPTLSQKSRITPVPVQAPKMKMSRSSMQLKSMSESVPPISVQTVKQPAIQDDQEGLRILGRTVTDGTIFILDCSFAAKALRVLEQNNHDFIIFAATSESLLYNPQLPCDLFTSCMLTPAKVALLWQTQSYSDIHSGLLSEIDIQNLIDLLNDSPVANEMLSMLEKALEAYVDKMAYEMLIQVDRNLFYKVFRKDPLTSRLFSNFMFAVRMMKTVSTLPVSSPALPDLSQHDLWDSFYLQIDRALYQLKESMKPTPSAFFSYNELLDEHMRRLESWMRFPKKGRPAPDEMPYLVLLLKSREFFNKAIDFCSAYLEISDETTEAFLNTQSFPILPQVMLEEEFLKSLDSTTLANFSFVVVNCILLSPTLSSYFEPHVDFWLKAVYGTSEDLIAASLCCLLLYADNPTKLQQYKDESLDELLLKLTEHESMRVRTLSHLILSKLGVGLSPPLKRAQDEISPQCRAAIVSRITTTMDTKDCDPNLRLELLYEVILLLNDPYHLVREEALVALSHALNSEDEQFVETFKQYIGDWRDEKANNPIITLLGHELQIMMFEPSRRVNERLTEFFYFLAAKFCKQPSVNLTSNLSTATLNKISHQTSSSLNPLTFATNTMIVRDSTLVGTPAISPSGLFACGDSDGRQHCQLTVGGLTDCQTFDFFKPGLSALNIPPEFDGLLTMRSKLSTRVAYSTYIDDMRLLSVSSRSQVSIINFNSTVDPECAFWMSPPDACNNVIADYNPRSFQVLHSTGTSLAHIYDLETMRKIDDIRLVRQPMSAMQWLKPYSTLFYVAQDSFRLFDRRQKDPIADLAEQGRGLLSCNCSSAMPLYLVSATTAGSISMVDMRMMETVARNQLQQPMTQFDVHGQLPFAVGITDTLLSFSFESGELEPEDQEIGFTPSSFALHQNEPNCAVREGSTVKCIIVDY